MWEAIQRAKGIPPDKYDQIFDDMIHRTVAGEVIPFDEWQDLVDDLEDERESAPDIETILREHGLTLPVLVERAETARRTFLDTLRRYGLPPENRFELCRLLYERAKEAPSDELLRLYCDIVSDGGFLLDMERAGGEGAVCWLYGKKDSDALYDYLSERAQINTFSRKALEEARNVRVSASDCGTDVPIQGDEIFQAYTRIFQLDINSERLRDNICRLVQIAGHSEALAPIKPLFLYRMLTRHGKRLQTIEDLSIDFHALWNYQQYKLDEYNGKNYRIYVRYLKLFSRLCSIFSTDQAVNLPLCVCGFEHLSNLNNFYHTYHPKTMDIPFAVPMEILLEESLFTCFERGNEDNVVMTDAGISAKALERFRGSTEKRHVRAMTKISEYMNRHIADLIPRFLNASPDEVKSLCTEILEAVALPVSQHPRTSQEAALFLATINSGLMEAIDYFTMEYLIAAGEELVS